MRSVKKKNICLHTEKMTNQLTKHPTILDKFSWKERICLALHVGISKHSSQTLVAAWFSRRLHHVVSICDIRAKCTKVHGLLLCGAECHQWPFAIWALTKVTKLRVYSHSHGWAPNVFVCPLWLIVQKPQPADLGWKQVVRAYCYADATVFG